MVDAVSFTVAPGEVCGFLGPNGSGKSTTIGMLLGTIRPTSGRAGLLGARSRADLSAARRRVGSTFEQPGFHPHLSAAENLRIAAMVKRAPLASIDAVLERVGLASRSRDRAGTFSLGMRQRLALASALLATPELLVLDEPTNGLDPQGVHDLRALLRRLAAQGTTVFMSSHLLHEVQALCTSVVVIREGRIVRAGDLATLAAGETLEDMFLAATRDQASPASGTA